VFFDSEFVNESALDDDAFDHNVKHCNSGLLIHVPKNVVTTSPIHVFYLQSHHDLVHNTRIVVEPNSEFEYFEYLYSEGEAQISFVSNSVVKENAKLVYSGIANLHQASTVTARRNGHVFRYGRCHYHIADVSNGDTDSIINVFLKERYAEGSAKTVAISDGDQTMRIQELIEHAAPETEGYIENYGVSNHASRLTFEGVGKINKNMKRAVARQSNRGIVLGDQSRLDANPLLLIDEYDVEASHGAAIGKIDEDQLYYLMSRGLPIKVAERLIISGFLSPVLELLTTEELRLDFLRNVERKTS
jgi:Fe-S cluster assembly protein SufD